MVLVETTLQGAYVIDGDRWPDNRGHVERVYGHQEFIRHGLNPAIAQINFAMTLKAGTIRGMHFQYPPVAQTKLIRCSRGAILDVIVDLRPESPTYLRHAMVELNSHEQRGLYIPERFAHGFQTLTDDTETIYLLGSCYSARDESGFRYDDAELGITWPLAVTEISTKDRAWSPLGEIEPELRRRMTL